MDLTDQSLAELFEQYKNEVRETIGTLDSELVAIEQDPGAGEVIFSIFRNLHSLKGSSKMFNVDNIGHIAHKLEDLMQIIDRDNTVLAEHPKIIELLFQGNDIFREIIDRLEDDVGFTNLSFRHLSFIEELNAYLNRLAGMDSTLLAAAKSVLDECTAIGPALETMEADGLFRALAVLRDEVNRAATMEKGGPAVYRYNELDVTGLVEEYESGLKKFEAAAYAPEDVDRFVKNAEALLRTLFETAGEDIMGILEELGNGLEMFDQRRLEIDPMVIEFFTALLAELKGRFRTEVPGAPTAFVPAAGEWVPPAACTDAALNNAGTKGQSKTIRVDERKIDVFLESVGRLITQSEILNHLQHAFNRTGIDSGLVRDFAAVNRSIAGDIVSLQRSIMEVRQVELDNILKKFPRLVRDISRKMGKEVELVVSGERAPIDKSLLDELELALIHIVRNAIDHGLESPEERAAAGKEPKGRIKIEVVRDETSVLIEVADDGRGVDYQAVRRRAGEKGWIVGDTTETLADEELNQFLFKSGMTTKTEVTEVSGRGVGLDVVMSNIRKWNGEVELRNNPGRGLSVLLRIPITNTLLTKEAILLRLGPTLFALPLDDVLEIVTVPRERIHRHKSRVVFQHRNSIVGVWDLKGRLGMAVESDREGQGGTFIVLKEKSTDRHAIEADEIVGQQKIVIKDFELEAFRRLPYYQGLSLLGDGRVVLVLDGEKVLR